MKSICIIIINFNGTNDTIECLKSLELSDYSNMKVAIIDNGSNEKEYEELRKYIVNNYSADYVILEEHSDLRELKKINFMKSDENLGFSGGNNSIIKIVDQIEKFDYYMLLNNDTLVEKNTISELCKCFSDKNVATATGLILSNDERDRIWFAGGYISKLKCTGKHQYFGKNIDILKDDMKYTKFSSGCMTMFRRDILFKLGLLNEKYFFGCEEYDYSLKIMRKGYKMGINLNAILYHKVKINDGNGSSHDIKKPMYIFNSMRNKQILAKENLGSIQYFIWKLIFRFYINLIFVKRFESKIAGCNDNIMALKLIKNRLNESFEKESVCLDDLREIESECKKG